MFGFLCNEFFKFKEQNTDAELEGFALEIDMQNKTNYNNIRKYLQEDMQKDIVDYDLRDYQFIGDYDSESETESTQARQAQQVDGEDVPS